MKKNMLKNAVMYDLVDLYTILNFADKPYGEIKHKKKELYKIIKKLEKNKYEKIFDTSIDIGAYDLK